MLLNWKNHEKKVWASGKLHLLNYICTCIITILTRSTAAFHQDRNSFTLSVYHRERSMRLFHIVSFFSDRMELFSFHPRTPVWAPPMAMLTSSMVVTILSENVFSSLSLCLVHGFQPGNFTLAFYFQLWMFFRNSWTPYYEVGTQSLSPHCYILIPTAGTFFNSLQLELGPFAEHIMYDRPLARPLSRFHMYHMIYISLLCLRSNQTVTKRANLCRPCAYDPYRSVLIYCTWKSVWYLLYSLGGNIAGWLNL